MFISSLEFISEHSPESQKQRKETCPLTLQRSPSWCPLYSAPFNVVFTLQSSVLRFPPPHPRETSPHSHQLCPKGQVLVTFLSSIWHWWSCPPLYHNFLLRLPWRDSFLTFDPLSIPGFSSSFHNCWCPWNSVLSAPLFSTWPPWESAMFTLSLLPCGESHHISFLSGTFLSEAARSKWYTCKIPKAVSVICHSTPVPWCVLPVRTNHSSWDLEISLICLSSSLLLQPVTKSVGPPPPSTATRLVQDVILSHLGLPACSEARCAALILRLMSGSPSTTMCT